MRSEVRLAAWMPAMRAVASTSPFGRVPAVMAADGPVVGLEAMKMEQSIPAPRDGVVATVTAEVGTTIKSGHVLLTLEKPE